MATNILPQIFTPTVEHLETAFPVNSVWERDTKDGVLAFEVIAHDLYEGETLIMLVEYQRYDKVWGWTGNGRADWLEVVWEEDDYQLYTYTDGAGVQIPLAVLNGGAA